MDRLHEQPFRIIGRAAAPGLARSPQIVGEISLPPPLADELERNGATLAELGKLVHRLHRENWRIRQRLARLERRQRDR